MAIVCVHFASIKEVILLFSLLAVFFFSGVRQLAIFTATMKLTTFRSGRKSGLPTCLCMYVRAYVCLYEPAHKRKACLGVRMSKLIFGCNL